MKRSPDDAPSGNSDREISLGAPAILGIFFALALLCAVFFGFGYSMGRKSAQSATADTAAANADTSGSGGSKPAAGSPASESADSGSSDAAQPASDDSTAAAAPTDATPAASDATPTPTPTPTPAPTKAAANPADSMIVGDKPAARIPSSSTPAPSKPAATKPAAANQSSAVPAGSFMVQVAAVSSQDVADIELAALKKKGYNVSIRHEPQDTLLHVQIGPFASRKDAQSMCQRVLADGFNAIVK